MAEDQVERYNETINDLQKAQNLILRAQEFTDDHSASEVLLDSIYDQLEYAITIRKREFRKSIGQDPFEED